MFVSKRASCENDTEQALAIKLESGPLQNKLGVSRWGGPLPIRRLRLRISRKFCIQHKFRNVPQDTKVDRVDIFSCDRKKFRAQLGGLVLVKDDFLVES